VEVPVEVKFQAQKRGVQISRNPLFLFDSGAMISRNKTPTGSQRPGGCLFFFGRGKKLRE
jgi:hypothetical protein